MAKSRDAKRQRTLRHATGFTKMTREAYVAANEDKRVAARLLKAQGQSNRAIASALGVSKDSIRLWCE